VSHTDLAHYQIFVSLLDEMEVQYDERSVRPAFRRSVFQGNRDGSACLRQGR